MGKYVFAYKGGGMASTEEERNAAMAAWGAWFTGLGDSVVDMGAPFGGSATTSGNGSADRSVLARTSALVEMGSVV